MTTDQPDTPVAWCYLPVVHHNHSGTQHHLTLRDQDGSVIRTTVAAPEHASLLEPYLHLHALEQRDPWTHGPAFVPVEELDGCWQFSVTGALYDRQALTVSETDQEPNTDSYRRLSFQ